MNKIQSIVIGALTISSTLAAGWDQSIDLGATVSKGNSDSVLGNLAYSAAQLGETEEYLVDAIYTYGKAEDTKTNDEFLFSAQWNHLFTETTYGGLRSHLRTDSLADIDYRGGIVAHYGAYLIKDDSTYLALETGLGYSVEKAGGLDHDDYLSLYFGQKFQHKFNDTTKVYNTLAFYSPAKDIEDFNIVFEAGVETFLSESFALNVKVQTTYDAEPAAGLKDTDTKLITALTYKF